MKSLRESTPASTLTQVIQWIRNTLARTAFLAIFLLPIIFLVVRSMAGIWTFPSLLPQTLNFRGFQFLASNSQAIWRSIASSFVYSTATIVLTLCISIAPAKILARNHFRGKVFVESILLAPLLIPGIVLTLSLYPVFFALRLTDNIVGIVLVLSLATFPYMLRSLVAGFESYGAGLETTASMLGAGTVRKLRTVHIPQLLPAILSGATVVFLSAFTEYFIVLLLGGGIVQSFSSYLLPLIRSGAIGHGSVLSLLFLVIPIVLYFVLDKFLNLYYNKRGLKIGG